MSGGGGGGGGGAGGSGGWGEEEKEEAEAEEVGVGWQISWAMADMRAVCSWERCLRPQTLRVRMRILGGEGGDWLSWCLVEAG